MNTPHSREEADHFTDTHPAPDLAALRTSLRVAVERVCHGAEWGAYRILTRPNGAAYPRYPAVRLADESVDFIATAPDPITDIGAAMALVDQLQAEGWPGASRFLFANALEEMGKAAYPWMWLEADCPPHLKAIFRTLAVLAARGAEWRRYKPLLTDASDAPPAS